MSLSFILGNLLGRAAISYLIVFVFCSLLSKLRLRVALAYSLRWYALLAVFVLTILGMSGAMLRAGGV